MESVGVRELRQNLSKYLAKVKQGESLTVTERGREVARLSPSGNVPEIYERLARELGATTPTRNWEDTISELEGGPALPAGTTDEILAEGRRHRA